MPWIVAAFVALILIALTHFFVINAQVIKRDMDKRFNEFRARLESDANSVLDDFLTANQAHDVRSSPPAAGTGHSNSSDADHI